MTETIRTFAVRPSLTRRYAKPCNGSRAAQVAKPLKCRKTETPPLGITLPTEDKLARFTTSLGGIGDSASKKSLLLPAGTQRDWCRVKACVHLDPAHINGPVGGPLVTAEAKHDPMDS